jgi:hypothetical protein
MWLVLADRAHRAGSLARRGATTICTTSNLIAVREAGMQIRRRGVKISQRTNGAGRRPAQGRVGALLSLSRKTVSGSCVDFSAALAARLRMRD